MPAAIRTTNPTATAIVDVLGSRGKRDGEVLTLEALEFVTGLHRAFDARRCELVAARRSTPAPTGFLSETASIRADASWRVAGAAPGLVDRRVEITGPVERKMTINALNSGALVWLADFEDALSPTWRNVIDGQINMRDAVRRQIELDTGDKLYRLRDDADLATIVVRPRGLHLDEKHVRLGSEPVAGALVDFGLFVFHNAKELIERGAGPYFYLPKLEHHLEARWWNDVFDHTEKVLGIEPGTIRATVLIETFPAAFQMEEILYELRTHAAGLNAGRWDYIFSAIKKHADDPAFVLPDRSDVTMTVPFMRAYTELLVRTCHKRGAHAIGGMAAALPSKDPQETAAAMAKITADKQREAGDGFDGSWVAHPSMVETCKQVFSKAFDASGTGEPHQLARLREDVRVTAQDLLSIPATPGTITPEGVRANVSVMLRYLDAWLDGQGAVGLDGLMEDAATAEISRCQLWQWVRHAAPMADGRPVTSHDVAILLEQELESLRDQRRPASRIEQLRALFRKTASAKRLPGFLTTIAYDDYLVEDAAR